MRTNIQRFRFLRRQLGPLSSPRLILLTGARQTGKTTLARQVYSGLAYFNLDAPEQREALREIRADAWAATVGPAILDEAQKEPSLFDKVKFAFDAGQIDRTVLLGSSQILMLQRVRETLAGRAFVYELWPLMASELVPSEELEKARALAKGRFVLQTESPNGLLLFGLRREVLEGEAVEPSELLAGLDAVTAEDVKRVAQDVIASQGMRLAVIGPFDDPARFEKLLA